VTEPNVTATLGRQAARSQKKRKAARASRLRLCRLCLFKAGKMPALQQIAADETLRVTQNLHGICLASSKGDEQK